MDEITYKVMRSTQAFLQRLIEAGALAPQQLTEAHMGVTALGYQMAQAQVTPAQRAQFRQAEQALVAALPVPRDGTAPPPAARAWQERWREGVGAELVMALEQAQTAPRDVAAWAERLKRFLMACHEPVDPTIGGGTESTYGGGRGDTRMPGADLARALEPASLQAYLRKRFAEHRDTRVLDLQRLMGGYSKETYFVTLDAGRGEERLVLRKDGCGLPTGSSVASEYGVLQQVHEMGVSVPAPLWLEASDEHFGTAFMALAFVRGDAAHLSVPTEPAQRQQWADRLARLLAHLHRATLRREADPRGVLRADVLELRARAHARERHPHPGIALGLSWLLARLDDLADRPVCRVHGDVGFHNMLMRDDGDIVLLDWEFSHLSDPVEDLIYVKPFIDRLQAWPQFLATYEAESGLRFDARAARYFNVWKEVRNAVACLGSLNSLLLPQVDSLALSVAGTLYIPKFEISVLDAILQGEPKDV